MPTVVDSLIVTLGLDPANFTTGQKQAAEALRKTREESVTVAKDMELRGKQAAQFFSQVKTEALGLMAVLLGGKGLESFTRDAVTSLAALGREAQNIGLQVPELAAFRNMIERNGGSADAATQSFRNLTDQMQRARVFGDNTDFLKWLPMIGATTADDPMAVYLKFAKFAQDHPTQIPLINQAGAALGLDQDSINEARNGVAQVQKDLAESYRLGVPTEGMTAHFAELQHDWIALRQSADNLGNSILENVQPGLSGVLNWMTQFIIKEPQTAQLIGEVGAALTVLGAVRISANLMGFGGLLVALNTIMAAATALVGVLDIVRRGPTGNIPANEKEYFKNRFGLGGAFNADENAQYSGLFDESGRPILKSEMGGGAQTIGRPSPGSAASDEMERTRQFFLSKGLSQEQVAGILASVSAESGFNPNATGDNGTSYGLFQHHAERLTRMQSIYGPAPTADQQREFLWNELQTDHADALAHLRAQQTAGGSGYVFRSEVEVPANTAQRAQETAAAAPQFLPGPRAAAGAGGAPAPISAAPDPAMRPTAAVPARAGAAPPAASTSTSSTDVRIGQIHVITQASDAPGISRDMWDAVGDELIAQSNRGLQ